MQVNVLELVLESLHGMQVKTPLILTI